MSPTFTDRELDIMAVLWERGSASIREITDRVYQKPSTTNYATVQKLLERLEEKGCVSRDRSSFAHVFRAKIDRADLIDEGLESLVSDTPDFAVGVRYEDLVTDSVGELTRILEFIE